MGNSPIVAIVGRPNVGKSALFNCLVQKRIAIVHDQPGVTRDRLVADCLLGSRPFTVVDTGGIESFVDTAYDEQIRSEANLAMEMADVIVLVGDSKDGVTPVDRFLAKELRSARKPVILAVNKIDHPKHELAILNLPYSDSRTSCPSARPMAAESRTWSSRSRQHLPEPTSTRPRLKPESRLNSRSSDGRTSANHLYQCDFASSAHARQRGRRNNPRFCRRAVRT